jgi:hypothetical protein
MKNTTPYELLAGPKDVCMCISSTFIRYAAATVLSHVGHNTTPGIFARADRGLGCDIFGGVCSSS